MAVRERYPNNIQAATLKAEIRKAIWTLLTQQGITRFPGPNGRVPNFIGAERAATLLRELTVWRKAQVIKVGPDAPPTLCDALQTAKVSPITFGILKARGARGLAVTEDEVATAVRWAWEILPSWGLFTSGPPPHGLIE